MELGSKAFIIMLRREWPDKVKSDNVAASSDKSPRQSQAQDHGVNELEEIKTTMREWS